MKYAVISDIHGNLSALQAVLADARRQGIIRYLFAGDYCISGPRPDECITVLREIPGAVIIRGNEEKYLENLIGAAESIAIGAAVYLLVVRPLLMASSANQSASGKRVYVNRWPAWLDLEDKVYRPLLSALTAGSSFVFRFIASIPDSKLIRVWIPAAFTAFFRFLAAAPESRPVLVWIPRLLTAATRFLSEITDCVALLIRRLLDSGRARKQDSPSGGFLPVERRRLITLAGHNVGRSLTFGLILTAAGLLLMIVYLLIRF